MQDFPLHDRLNNVARPRPSITAITSLPVGDFERVPKFRNIFILHPYYSCKGIGTAPVEGQFIFLALYL